MHSKMVPYAIVRFECQLIIEYPEQGGPSPPIFCQLKVAFTCSMPSIAPSPNPS